MSNLYVETDYVYVGYAFGAVTYFAAYPAAVTPTWTRGTAQDGWSGTPTAYGQDTDSPTVDTVDDEPTISWSAPLTVGVQYRLWALWDDGNLNHLGVAPLGSDAFASDSTGILVGGLAGVSGTAARLPLFAALGLTQRRSAASGSLRISYRGQPARRGLP